MWMWWVIGIFGDVVAHRNIMGNGSSLVYCGIWWLFVILWNVVACW
jgi:hypothetical protein